MQTFHYQKMFRLQERKETKMKTRIKKQVSQRSGKNLASIQSDEQLLQIKTACQISLRTFVGLVNPTHRCVKAQSQESP